MLRQRRADDAVTVDVCVLGVAPRFVAKASLTYLVDDPYAVGVHEAVGEGAVTVAPGVSRRTLSEFLSHTVRLVPVGAESAHIDINQLLVDLLAPTPGSTS